MLDAVSAGIRSGPWSRAPVTHEMGKTSLADTGPSLILHGFNVIASMTVAGERWPAQGCRRFPERVAGFECNGVSARMAAQIAVLTPLPYPLVDWQLLTVLVPRAPASPA